MAEHQIDPETVKRCIEALRTAPGVYSERKTYTNTYIDAITIDNAVVTLEGLLPEPEKTNAEKLVDEWCQSRGMTLFGDIIKDYASFADFVLDRVSEKVATAINTEPSYVYGPWIKWEGGKCPVPGDWRIETVLADETVANHDEDITTAQGWRWTHIGSDSDITHYRVRFEVGKWYDWTGGPCPIDGETRAQVRFRYGQTYEGSGKTSFWSNGSYDWWKHEGLPDDNIIAFKVVPQ